MEKFSFLKIQLQFLLSIIHFSLLISRDIIFIMKIAIKIFLGGQRRKMNKIYETPKVNMFLLADEDVLTASADFTDTNGDNGVWFPGQNPNGKEDAWQ